MTEAVQPIFGVLVIWFLWSSFYSWYRLRHIPGPFLASISHAWLAQQSIAGTHRRAHRDIAKYGRLVRTGPNYLVTDDPDILRRIHATRRPYPRDPWYTGLRMGASDYMATITDTDAHDRIKAKLASGYGGRDGVDMEGLVDQQVVHLIEVIRDRYLSKGADVRPVDFSLLVRYFALDVITSVDTGKALGFLDADGDLYGYTKTTDSLFLAFSLSMDNPVLRWLLQSPLCSFLYPRPTDKTGIGKIQGIFYNIIRERYANGKTDDPDMLGSFMRHGVTEEENLAECLFTLLAGSDTSATVIRVTLLYIMSTPRVYARLKAEIRDATASASASSTSTTPSGVISVERARALPYLQAVIHEAVRVHPPVLYGHFKRVPAGGDTLGGHFVPAGTAVGENMVGLMRRAAVFGLDVDVFRPERFLAADPDRRAEMERAVDHVFGMGRWTCAGRQLAMTELHKVFFELLRVFDFQPMYPVTPIEETSYFMAVQKNMYVRITEADSD